MQVKVLYTFDGDSKTNCLARCPAPLAVQTANLDGGAQIGIIELRTCIQAIVTASPELVAKLGQDYTVYAYDFSEYETPLVGQGMLSWVLASSSTTPNAHADQSRTMVTGRVSKNVMGLFSQDAMKEILEVKLKLVPVPTCLQSEYLASMQKYRDASTVAAADFDTAAWTAFLKANPGFGEAAAGMQDYQELDNEEEAQVDDLYEELQPAEDARPMSQHSLAAPRPLQPPVRQQYPPLTAPSGSASRSNSRPSSRGSGRGRPPNKPRNTNPVYESLRPAPIAAAPEDGPARKRARVEQTDWHGSSTFGLTKEPLRVTASTAASIRGQRPALAIPSASELAAGELSARPPTPRPMPPLRTRHALKRTDTSLAQDAITRGTRVRRPSNLTHQDVLDSAFSSVTSPNQTESAGSTPMDLPSSPPVMDTVSPAPSSPALPVHSANRDSGFFSGAIDDEYGMTTFDENRVKSGSRRYTHDASTHIEIPFTMEIPGDPALLPRTSARPRPKAPRQPSKKRGNGSVAGSSPKALTSMIAPSDGSFSEPTLVGTEEPLNEILEGAVRRNLDTELDRARSESYLLEDEPGSAAAEPGESTTATITRQAGSGVKRRKKIQGRLMADIAAGKMPPYCRNCGQINTPTWRKAFIKVEQGNPDDFVFPENDEGYLAWEAVDKTSEDEINSFRIIRKWIDVRYAGYDEWQLCNSCGIHLFKYKTMRPPQRWHRDGTREAPGKKRPSRSTKTDARNGEGQADGASDSHQPSKNHVSGAGAQDDKDHTTTSKDSISGRSDRSQPKTNGARQRPSSAASTGHRIQKSTEMSEAAAAAALHKAFQSSPPKFPGSKASPIGIDTDQSPVRRVLFPSPRKPGEVRSPDPNALDTTKDKGAGKHSNDRSFKLYDQADKENLAPDTSRTEGNSKQSTSNNSPTSAATGQADSCNPLATPKKSRTNTPRSLLSTTKRWLGATETPSRASLRDMGPLQTDSMSPFSAQLTRLINQACGSPSKNSPQRNLAIQPDDLENDAGPCALPDFGNHELDFGFETSDATLFDMHDDPLSAADVSWDAISSFGQQSFEADGAPVEEMQAVEMDDLPISETRTVDQQPANEEEIGAECQAV
ncbi:MAG: hypothetical protein M1828_000696 [Chrysothrix sp. TS-e1954]|nr:MAG: hypothetical protein M1828_000696 [Chrysothrix sp. TS-e1954]